MWQKILEPNSHQHCGTFKEFSPPTPLSFWDDLVVVGNAQRSQFDALRDFPEGDPSLQKNMACLALEGSRFHGQRNRNWRALRGNIHLSARIPVDLCSREFSASLVMLPAVAVMDSLNSLVGPLSGCGIKWVNDILLHGKKMAGVLTAARNTSGVITSVVFGIGFNVNLAPEISPDGFAAGTTSLRDHLGQSTPCLGDVLFRLLQDMGQRIDELHRKGGQAVYDDYCEQSLILKREVVIHPDPPAFEQPKSCPHQEEGIRGRVEAINPDLSLKLEGRHQPVISGRLAFSG